MDGHATGQTRCNVSSHVLGLSLDYQGVDRISGEYTSNKCAMVLDNRSGIFSDDQYAAFDASAEQYNGLVTQKYLTNRNRVRVESWYAGDFDNLFVGMVATGYERRSVTTQFGVAAIGCEDYIGMLQAKRIRIATKYEDKKLSDATEADSLVHILSRLATKRYWKNYQTCYFTSVLA